MAEAKKPSTSPAVAEKATVVKESVESNVGSAVGLSGTKKLGLAVVVIAAVALVFYIVLPGDKEDKSQENVKPKKEAIDKAMKDSQKAVPRAEDDLTNAPEVPSALPSIKDLALSMPEPPKPPPPPKTPDSSGTNPFSFDKIKLPAPPPVALQPSPEKPPMFLPPPPPPGFDKPSQETPDSASTQARSKELQERRGSNVIVIDNTGKLNSSTFGQKKVLIAPKEININAPLEVTSASQIAATFYGKRSNLIAQGKIIDIVIETAINTDLKGMIRGIIGHDVYSEAGDIVLIPRGSRAVGEYSASLSAGQSRVAVVWNRIIRPDGIDFVLDMVSTDPMGRSGVTGEVDYHFPEIMRNSIMMSLLTIASGVILTDIFNDNVVTQTVNSTTGAVTTASSAAYQQTQGVMNEILNQLQESMNSSKPAQQTIHIAQGTIVKAFVSKDIVVPEDAINGRQNTK